MMHEHRNHLFPSCDPQTSVTLAPVNRWCVLAWLRKASLPPAQMQDTVPRVDTEQLGMLASWGGGGGGWLQSAPWDSGLRGQLWWVSVLGTLPAPPPTRSSCSHEPEGLEAGLGHLSASRSFLRWAII